MNIFIRYIIPLFLLTYFLVNSFVDEPQFSSVQEEINHAEQTGNHLKISQVYEELVRSDSMNIDWHYHYLNKQFDKAMLSKSMMRQKLDYLVLFYESLTEKKETKMKDIGHFSLGLIFFKREKYDDCLAQWSQISNQDIKYLNNYYGLMYLNAEDKKAEDYFRRELAWGGDKEGAYRNLAYLYNVNKQDEKLKALFEEPEAEQYIPLKIKRQMHLREGNMLNYFKVLYKRFHAAFQFIGIAGAFLVSFIWMLYLRRIDFTSKSKKPYRIISVWLFSMLFAFLTTLLSDTNKYIIGYSLKGDFINDFMYSVLGIGAIEELMKIIPFLIVLSITKWIKEPIDYIHYACVCALGFAFMENMLYFTDDGIKYLQGRALTATFSHMFDSSIIAYSLVLAKFTPKKNKVLYFIGGFALAAFTHGFYDFWLIYPTQKIFNIFTLLFLLASMFMWMSMINNCLNNSSWIEKTYHYNQKKVFSYLLVSLSLLFVFEYVAISIKFGPDFAQLYTVKGMSSGLFLLLFITFSLSKLDHVKHYWAPIKFWDWQTVLNVPSLKPQFFNLQEIIGQKVHLDAFRKSSTIYPHMPVTGKIVSRELISWEKDWYLIELDNPIILGWRTYTHLLVKNRKANEVMFKYAKQVVYVRLISDIESLEKKLKRKMEYPLIDFAVLTKS